LVRWSYRNIYFQNTRTLPDSGFLHRSCFIRNLLMAAQPQSQPMAKASGEHAALPALLLMRRKDAALNSALRERFRVLDFFASGEPLPAFLAAAAASPEPPRAAVVMGGGTVRVDAALLDALPSLRCVVGTGAGIDHIDLHECARRGVAVANAGRIYSADVADHAVGMLIDVLRRVSAAERFVRRGLWPVQGDYPLGTKVCPALLFVLALF
jgi:glyoxylate/hydroxypyruvate reductase